VIDVGVLGDAISGVIGYQIGKRRRSAAEPAGPRAVTAESAIAALRSAIAQGEQVMRSQGVEPSEAESILGEGGYTAADLRDPNKRDEIAALFAKHGIEAEQ
jgi:hypothetical protein